MSAPETPPDALRRALGALRDMKERLERAEGAAHEPIAVIGAGCRLPGGADSLASYWELLHSGTDAIGLVPADRWDSGALYDPDPDAPGKIYTDQGGFVDWPVDGFDAGFFGISPREANSLDPQQRLLLEVAWEAFENAGIAPDQLAGSATGVFVGLGTSDYADLQVRGGDPADIGTYFGTGVAPCIAAGRISYLLGLRGPALTLDTACSSSLVAIALAVQSLRSRSCRAAIAGGINLMLDSQPSIYLCRFRALSPTGRCHTFSADADGYVRGEGCGLVVLKRLSDAQADGDRIMAVIRGAAINHDGRSSGLTVPSGAAQREVMEQALADAGLAPEDIDLIEAHGTGTELGDPIEVRALESVYAGHRTMDSPLLIGSAKTNIGHLEAAAGVAGVLKLVLALQHEEIPRHLHCDQPSPHIDWGSTPIAVASDGQAWPRSERPRRAAASAFGFSGTNAHVILEEAPSAVLETPRQATPPAPTAEVLTLSAKDETALSELAARFADHLDGVRPCLPDLVWTAQTGRGRFPHRLATVARSSEEASARLRSWLAGDEPAGVVRADAPVSPPQIAFVFTGQGAQHPSMGRDLYEREPVFRASMDDCDRLLRPHLSPPLLEVMYGDDERVAALVHNTAFTQPAIFAVEYGLAQLWRSWGIEPSVVVGHSIGEYAAACVAGVFSLEDALGLIAARGRLMGNLPPGGAMVAVFEDEDHVRRILEPYGSEIGIAASNGPDSVVISGGGDATDEVVASLVESGIRHRRLQVSHAFHSPLMAPMIDEFELLTRAVEYHHPTVPFVSTVTGKAETDDVATARYWRDHIAATVRFADAATTLLTAGVDQFLEIGPQPTLLGMLARLGVEGTGLHPSIRPGRDDSEQMAETLSRLWSVGIDPDWSNVHRERPSRVDAPTYPFQRRRHWFEAASRQQALSAAIPDGAAARRRAWMYDVTWAAMPAPTPLGAQPGSWLIVADQVGFADDVADEMTTRGQRSVVVRSGEGLDRLLEAVEPPPDGWAGVLFAAGLDAGGDAPDPVEQERALGGLLVLTRALLRASTVAAGGGRLWVMTRGAQSVNQQADPVALAQAPLWGLANAVSLEEPSLRVGCVDLARRGAGEAPAVVDELLSGSDEDRIAFRSGKRYGARLAPVRREALDVPQGDYALAVAERGSLDGLVLVPSPPLVPRAGEVAISVRASGLNFRDVLHVLGMHPGDAGALGLECAGVVVAVGDAVDDLEVGDEVVALVEGAFGRHVIAPAQMVFPLPHPLDFAAAATIPIAFLTAQYGLDELAGVGVGDVVLIHAAAGGVGMAAVQIARSAGAVVIGTAGSAEKRSFLRSLGVEHVFDSRSLDFAPQVMTVTGGRGVDIALNSLADEFIGATLDVVADGGVFLEIGERDIWSSADVAERYPRLRYQAYDLSDLVVQDPDHLRAMLQSILSRVSEGTLVPLPHRCFAIEDVRTGFRYMAMAHHIGKVVVTHRRVDEEMLEPGQRFAADGSYLITGGRGGLGLEAARSLVGRGARHVMLVSRSEPSAAAGMVIDELRRAGAAVEVAKADVGQRDQLEGVLGLLRDTMPPLRGVIHAAGIIDDALVRNLDWSRFERVLQAKVAGAWHLHELTAEDRLDFFAMYSSAASLLGASGQASYATANAYLDGLAHHRQALGLPGLSINWGGWAGVGMAADLDERTLSRWDEVGVQLIDPLDGDEILVELLHGNAAQVGILPIDWTRMSRHLGTVMQRPFLERVVSDATELRAAVTSGRVFADELEDLDAEEQISFVRDHVRATIIAVLGLDPDVVLGDHQGLPDLGMDSLMAVELSNRLQRSMAIPLDSTVAFEWPTLDALTRHLVPRVIGDLGAETVAESTKVPVSTQGRLAEVQSISDEEAERSLLVALERSGY